MKRIAIVAGHFPPSNLTAVHRARLWAQHLPEFGWTPIIVTADSRYYEEQLDPALLELVSPELRVIRTKALPVKPVRVVGDIGARALFWHYKALSKMIVAKEIDFFHITIPSNTSALLGELLYRRYRFPFGIDYIDPWVHVWPGVEKPFSKAWASFQLSKLLEPWAVKNVSLVTGVAPLYYQGMIQRNPRVVDRCVMAAMPYGNSKADYQTLRDGSRETFLFPKNDGLFHIIYAGAMLPNAYVVFERLLEALVLLREHKPNVMKRLRIHFVGTGKAPNDAKGYNIRPHVERFGLEDWIEEHPTRIGYVDVLNHYTHCSGILILGSTEEHYTPSKIYQAVEAKRPIFALLHEQSTAVKVLEDSKAGTAVTFTEGQLPQAERIAESLASFVSKPVYSVENVQWGKFEGYSARNSAQTLAQAVDAALQKFRTRTISEDA